MGGGEASAEPGVGTWRSQVAHSAGGRVVAGSNPAVPTPCSTARRKAREGFGDDLPSDGHRGVLSRHRRVLFRRVRAPGLPLEPLRGRLLEALWGLPARASVILALNPSHE